MNDFRNICISFVHSPSSVATVKDSVRKRKERALSEREQKTNYRRRGPKKENVGSI